MRRKTALILLGGLISLALYSQDRPKADYTKLAGRIPLPPKYAFGYWWRRYWAYTDDELRDIASQMRTRGVPMDVVIIDMDWHETWKELD